MFIESVCSCSWNRVNVIVVISIGFQTNRCIKNDTRTSFTKVSFWYIDVQPTNLYGIGTKFWKHMPRTFRFILCLWSINPIPWTDRLARHSLNGLEGMEYKLKSHSNCIWKLFRSVFTYLYLSHSEISCNQEATLIFIYQYVCLVRIPERRHCIRYYIRMQDANADEKSDSRQSITVILICYAMRNRSNYCFIFEDRVTITQTTLVRRRNWNPRSQLSQTRWSSQWLSRRIAAALWSFSLDSLTKNFNSTKIEQIQMITSNLLSIDWNIRIEKATSNLFLLFALAAEMYSVCCDISGIHTTHTVWCICVQYTSTL